MLKIGGMKRTKMKIITINLSEKYLSALQTLVDLGRYPSRSEEIRIALQTFLKNELKFDQNLEPDNFYESIRGIES